MFVLVGFKEAESKSNNWGQAVGSPVSGSRERARGGMVVKKGEWFERRQQWRRNRK